MTLIIDLPKLREIQASGKAVRLRKTAPTRWRYTTQADINSGLVSKGMGLTPTPGIINTLEGPKAFEAIICYGANEEYWPMDEESFFRSKKDSGLPADENGWLVSYNTNSVWAYQVTEDDFTVVIGHEDNPLSQKAGSYLIFDGDYAWPLAEDLIRTYEPVKTP